MRNEVYAIWRKILPFHDDEETFWAVESVLVDVVYVDDVEAIGSLPVKLNLPTSLHRVFQNFQGAFGPLRGGSTLKIRQKGQFNRGMVYAWKETDIKTAF